jgi:putative flippase GtrA
VTPLVRRWFKFNLVSVLGIGVQLAVLWLLVSRLRMGYLPATALAVEAAVLHNFVWHERYTWRGRPVPGARERLARLLRFHLGNGLVSLVGNVALMRLLVGVLHLPYLVANLVAIAACGLLNFALSEWFVFRESR